NSGWKTQATKVVDADGNEVANADKSTAVNPGDTVNYVDGKGTKANVAVTKVDGQPDVVNVSYDLNLNNHLTPVDNTTKSVTKAPFDAGTTGKEAATVNDVLNAGWNLKANNEDVDAVTHADAVNFTSDDGSVVITPTTDGKTTKLNFSVDKASVANSVVASTKGNASVNSTTGKAVVGKDGNADTTAGADAKFATTGDVVNTINNTGWKTKATDGTDVTVNPGDAVNYVDGKGTKANVAVTKVDGQDVVNVSYDVKSADTDTLTVDANGVKVNTGSLVNASTAEGDANRGKVTVNAGDENKVATVKNVADAINSAAWTVKVADSQEAIETSTANDKGASVSAGTTVTHTAGKNLKVKRDGNNVTYALANDVSVNTVTTETATVGKGDAATTISTSKAGDNVTEVKFGDNAGKPVRVTNVANGVKEGDAVNVRQLNDAKANIHQNTQAIGKLNDKIDQVEKRGRKGTAIAGAIGMLPQPHTSGKSMVGVATTNYRGEQAVAVGYSRLSDNGKHIIKLSGSSNVSGKKDAMVGAAYGFQW
ncbi:YadA family autotransporter adhesin, partial [Haemophilus paraphrohaemolyticus]